MNTPIADFVRGYEKQSMTRFHMPGHKGQVYLGCEMFDITEVSGADSLYEARGIIAQSEANATALFGTARTVYATEGSSQCIRAMLYLAMMNNKVKGKKVVLATRNAHKAFVHAAAVLDFEVQWLWPKEMHSLCSCQITAQELEDTLQRMDKKPCAVYVTSPDYLGETLDIEALADVCHKRGTILAVDNAHGAYLHFLNPSLHPIDLGADICCDSAHKTLPVLTGGAYLQIGKNAPQYFAEHAKQAMALFGSTSPSYLTLASLDLCNAYLTNEYGKKLERTIERVEELRKGLRHAGWKVEKTEPLKLTICAPKGITGEELADILRMKQIECEYADEEYLVCMITPENAEEDLKRFSDALGENAKPNERKVRLQKVMCEQRLSIREAVFSEHEIVPIDKAVGRTCGMITVSCPPAIPIVVSGERINEDAISLFAHYGIENVEVVKNEEEER